MKLIFTLTILLFSITISAQKKIKILPKWKINEKKTVYVNRVDSELKKGKLVSETSDFEYTFEIYKETKTHYFIKFNMGSVANKSFVEFTEKMESSVSPFQSLELKYKVEKSTGEYSLINLKEVKDHALGSIVKIEDVIKEKSKEEGMESLAMLSFLLEPLKSVYETEESINGYFLKEFEFIFEPFEVELEKSKVINVKDSADNPFRPGQVVSGSKDYLLIEMDEKADTALLQVDLNLDFSQFVEMMKGMMEKMIKGFTTDSLKLEEKLKELNHFEMDMNNQKWITLDTKTNLPTKVIQKVKVYGNDPKSGRRETNYLIKISIK
tara:strand:+ start:152 stop:1123 length:972 start_codon:yes stop_codon:yes gene_type:complete